MKWVFLEYPFRDPVWALGTPGTAKSDKTQSPWKKSVLGANLQEKWKFYAAKEVNTPFFRGSVQDPPKSVQRIESYHI